MSTSTEAGHFAKKQLLSRSRLISWSHTRRFQVGLKLIGDQRGKRVLDHGCGDATFLAMMLDAGNVPADAIGAEIDPRVLSDNVRRLGHRPTLTFLHLDALAEPEYTGSFDTIVCMEVCEHMPRPETTLDLFHRLLKPGGMLLLSVPVETGLPILIKQTARCIAGWRGIGDYPGTNPYTWPELIRSVVAGSEQHIERPMHYLADGTPFRDHKGFNWMALRRMIADRFEITRVTASPLTWLTPHLASQVWFSARKAG